MTIHRLYHAGGHTSNPDTAIFPAAEVTETNPVTRVSGHRENVGYGIERAIDTRKPVNYGPSFGWRNQDAVRHYLNLNPVVVDDTVQLVVIPPRTALQGIAWAVDEALVGVSFDIEEVFSGAVIATGLGAALGSDFVPAPIVGPPALPVWHDTENRIFQVRFTAVPAEGIEGLSFKISAVVFDPFTGK